MSAPIGPGDWVECVESAMDPRLGHEVVAGRVYEVSRVHAPPGVCPAHGPSCNVGGVDLVGMPDPDRAWCAARFRPIYRPKQELIERLKAPPKVAAPRVDAPETVEAI